MKDFSELEEKDKEIHKTQNWYQHGYDEKHP